MKIFFFVIFLSLNSIASKARLQALNNSRHIVDVQTVYSNPLDLNLLDNFASFETGLSSAVSSTTTAKHAEAAVSYALNEQSRIMLGIGHQDEAVVLTRSFVNKLGFAYDMMQNPVHLFYGYNGEDIDHAVGLFYSNFEDKLTGATEFSSGISYGAQIGAWSLYGTYTLVNSAQTAAVAKFDGSGYFSGSVSYIFDTSLIYLTVSKSPTKSSTAGIETESHNAQVITFGLIDSNKKEDNDVFWSAQLISTKVDCHMRAGIVCERSFASTSLPVSIGLEAQANAWLVWRSAITQSVLINQSKDDIGYPINAITGATGGLSDVVMGANNTSLATGVGLKFNNFIIDGVLSASTTQLVNAANLTSQLGLTYQF